MELSRSIATTPESWKNASAPCKPSQKRKLPSAQQKKNWTFFAGELLVLSSGNCAVVWR
jgi:hypothetical protein